MLVRSQLERLFMNSGNVSTLCIRIMDKIRDLMLLGFDKHPNVGGACGEIAVDTGRGCSLLLTSPLAASQNFEVCLLSVILSR